MRVSRKLMPLAVTAALAAWSGGTLAGGFALIEQNASGLGNAFAGQAAAAEDASTIFFNPAGMARLPGRQFVGAVHLIWPSAEFNNTGSTAAAGGFPLGSNGGDAGDLAIVPNAYLSWQLNPQWFVGVGLSAPFGLKTEYDADWMGRFHALKSEVKAINVNPSVAFKINDAFSVGIGLNYQRFDAELTKAINYTAVGAAAGIPVAAGTAGSNKIEADDDAWGFNLGVMFNLGANATVGLSYRSEMKYTLSGTVAYAGRPAALAAAAAVVPALANQVADSDVSAKVKLPASFSAAVKHQLDPKWQLLADVTWTEWSSLQSLDIVRTSGIASGTLLESTPFEWRDTWRVGIGANYRHSDAWTLRFGAAYDQTPVRNQFRTPRVPDESRTWVALGAQYRMSKAFVFDVGYAHLFMKDASVSLTGPPELPSAAVAAGRGRLVGNYDSNVNILSAQLRYSF
jgi:long-chain fatty acid transport protein